MNRMLRRLAFFLFLFLQFSFLFSILFEKLETPFLVGIILVLSGLLSFAYYQSPRSEERFFIKDSFLILFVVSGAIISYLINLKMGPVIAAGATGTVASFIPSFIKSEKRKGLVKEVPAAVYCGAFVGMTAPAVAGNLHFIIFAGFIAGTFLLLAKNIFNGFGGKLGTIAFGGVALASAVIYWIF
ncbi:hypothetical protein [Christiangramia flava]|nr:hypothetical protein [Christiangramia flava]